MSHKPGKDTSLWLSSFHPVLTNTEEDNTSFSGMVYGAL